MSWWGKIVGGVLGFSMGGPLGALLGMAIGHQFDDRGGGWSSLGGDAERVQAAFFTATFSVMGHLAKADGRVSESEIRMARGVMAHMNLSPDQVETAIKLFNQGKQPDFPLDDVMQQFRRECHRRGDLMRMFIEIQIQAALADGEMSAAERKALERIGAHLNIPAWEIHQLEALIRAAQRRYAGGGRSRSAPARADELADAYKVLGVQKSASDSEVKNAYRRLMSRHHPDKLASKGLPEEMMRLAEEKAQEITAAYDRVKEARGMK